MNVPKDIAASNQPVRTAGAAGFMEWLRRYQPYFYREVKGALPAALGSFGADAASAGTQGTSPSWATTIQNVITAAGQAWLTKEQIDAQKKILNLQLDRARSGLPPLDIDPQTMGLPGASVSFGLSSDTKKLLLYGGLAAAGLFVFSSMSRRPARR